MDSELPSFLVWSLCIKCLVHHEVYSVSWSCLLSFLCNPYIPFQIYEIFYLLVILVIRYFTVLPCSHLLIELTYLNNRNTNKAENLHVYIFSSGHVHNVVIFFVNPFTSCVTYHYQPKQCIIMGTETETNMKICMYIYFIPAMRTMLLYFH